MISPLSGLAGSSAIVGGTIPIAVGAALAFVMQKKKNVAIVNFGDGAVDEGVFYESLNFAALKNLPVIFVCENNFYATHAHQSLRQSKDNIYEKARVFGIPSLRIDGNDVLEIFAVCRSAVDAARKGKGPYLIECRTYRWLEHVGPNYDYALGYRSRKEFQAWKRKCPVECFSRFLINRKIITKSQLEAMRKSIESDVEKAVKFAKESPFPSDSELLKDVYCL